jgi:hypothetical protein
VREDPITPAQRKLLEALRGKEAVRGFYLAGGSALALRLRHRRSLDHDFFRQAPFRPTDLAARIAEIHGPVTPLQVGKGTLTVEASGVKASFFEYPYPLLEPLEDVDGLFPTASLLDIALMKLTAIADRGARKDFIDLHAILSAGLDLHELLSRLGEKFPGASYQRYHFLKALTYFDDAVEEPLMLLALGAGWEEIKDFFRREVGKIHP